MTDHPEHPGPHPRFAPAPLRCPYCANGLQRFDDEEGSERPQPVDADVFVCLTCLGVGIFVVSPLLGTRVRPAKPDELDEHRAHTSKVIDAIVEGRSRGLTNVDEILAGWQGARRPRPLGSIQ